MYKLSVCLISYNQESFIAEAIEGVVNQKTDFPFELVIADDCSTDSTLSIIQTYKQKYPDLIRIVPRPENLGMMANFLASIGECKSEYVALLEGDDYWMDVHKLQKQVDFLEKNPLIAVCFHPVRIKNQSTGAFKESKAAVPGKITTTRDILKLNYIATCSVIFRNPLGGVFPGWIRSLSMGDWPVHILNSLQGDIYCHPDIMGVYRIHGASEWTHNLTTAGGMIKTISKKLDLFIKLRENLPAKWQGIISSNILAYQKLIEIYSCLSENKGVSISTWSWLVLKSLGGQFDCRVCLKFLIKSLISR